MRAGPLTMGEDCIVVAGAREHNLRNVTVRIPRNKLVVITGLSGSGKSSLAFDTLYAEGQRRYVESLSAFARQFLDRMRKPDVDYIVGLSPAIAIEQRAAGGTPRSIVATTTEIHDYLRLLFAHVGARHCPKCGRPVGRQAPEEIVERLLQLPAGAKLWLLAPLVRGRRGEHADALETARKQGFVRLRIDGVVHEIENLPNLDRRKAHSIDAVVDRLIVTNLIRPRLTDSVETALKHGNGLLMARHEHGAAWREEIFSEKNACPDCKISFNELTPRNFSFNSPCGACPTCSGLGTQLVLDEDLIVPDRSRSIEQGAVQAWRKGGRRLIIYYKQLLRAVARHYGFSLDVPFKDLDKKFQDILFQGSGDEAMEFGFWRDGAWHRREKTFEGIIPNLRRRYETTDSELVKQRLRGYMSRRECPGCCGARLKPESLACAVNGKSIVAIIGLSAREAMDFFQALPLSEREQRVVAEVLKEIRRRLRFLVEVGLDYLTLDRDSGSLSGGEMQRIRLATQIGSGLVGVLYVLDEPTIGLHPRDNERLIRMLRELRDMGNTVIVVEHDAEMIRQADYVIDLGPGAGRRGGRVISAGTVPELLANPKSLTGRFLSGAARIHAPTRRRSPGEEQLVVRGAAEHNLKNIDVAFPLGLLICVTGVSGSGKSTLVDDILRRTLFRRFYGGKEKPGRHRAIAGIEHLDKAVVIDQSPIGRTPRSNPVTYTGAFTDIRNLFAATSSAKTRGYGPGRFSFNVKGGRCEVCRGDGILRLEMHFLPDVFVTCEQCRGLRYNPETLEALYKGRNIAEVLSMTIGEALEFFRPIPSIERKLRTLAEVGLGYLQLGQPATTLSGGEAQRIKLSAELSRKATGRTLYLLDEPTTGLHFADTQKLLKVLHGLCEAGNTVVVIEHNLDVVKTADYVIDLGPEGGDRGGEVVAIGTPEDVARCERSYTGQFLKKALA
ncbi:MAG: excinuclease ABC subunit UvrA [Verrucomicrobiota bacterium]|nr:excinuclease ABC subunit UvrA [Verrucomicrobiota bacterium]